MTDNHRSNKSCWIGIILVLTSGVWLPSQILWTAIGSLGMAASVLMNSLQSTYYIVLGYVGLSFLRLWMYPQSFLDSLVSVLLPPFAVLLLWQLLQWRDASHKEQHDYVFQMDEQGRIGYVNPSLAGFLGRTQNDIRGQSALSVGLLGVRNPLGRIQTHVAENDQPLLLSWWVSGGSDHLAWIQWSLRRTSENRYHTACIEAVGRDLTEWKQADEHTQQIVHQLQILHALLLELHKVENRKDVERLLVDSAEELFSLAHCAVFWWEEGRMDLASLSPSAEWDSFAHWGEVDGLIGRAYEQGSLQQQQLPYTGPEAKSFGSLFYRWVAAAPLGRFGVMATVTPDFAGFNHADLEALDLLAAHAQESISRLVSREKLQFMNGHDSLTGLHNRAFFEKKLIEWDHPQYYPLTVIMGDMNGLKFANDVFGHVTGDRLLKDAAEILRKSIRQGDLAVRLGGDEFVLVLPNTTEQQAEALMQRVKDRCGKGPQLPIQVSIAMGAASHVGEEPLWDVIAEAEDRMYRAKIEHSQHFKEELLESIQRLMHAKSHESLAHMERMKKWSVGFGRHLGLSEREVSDLGLAAVFHDMGVIALPESVLKSAEPLTVSEWEEMRRHPEVGFRIAESSKTLGHIAPIILHHHEHWDGSGYPRGIGGEAIPYLARIIAIVDAFEVMTHGRPYATGRDYLEALGAIEAQAGVQFDPNLAAQFVKYVDCKKKAGRTLPGKADSSSGASTKITEIARAKPEVSVSKKRA